MSRFAFPILIFVTLSCDFIDCGICYPGAPVLGVEFVFSEETDSSYSDLNKWKIFDDSTALRIRYSEDSVDWDYSLPYMNLLETDSSVQFIGDGVIWGHLDRPRFKLVFDFGNGDVDTLGIKIGVNRDLCCQSNSIDKVTYNGDSLSIGAGYFYKAYIRKK